MKKILLIFLCLISIAIYADARMTAVMVGCGSTSAAPSCETVAQSSATGDVESVRWGNYASTPSIGTQFTASKNMTVCKIDVRLKEIGTITTGTIYAAIYADNGSNNVTGSAIGGNSNAIDATTLTSTHATYTFDGMSATLSSGTLYYIVLTFTGTLGGSNYPSWQACQWSGRFQTGTTSSLLEEVWTDRSGWFVLYE